MTHTNTPKVNQVVNYVNGSEAVYTGTIKKITNSGYLVIIDETDEAAVILWNAGFAIGDCIRPSQLR